MSDPNPTVAEDATGNPTSVTGYFRDDSHSIKAGFFIGTMMKAGITVRPEVDDQGNFMPKMVIELPAIDPQGPPVEVWIKVLAGRDAL